MGYSPAAVERAMTIHQALLHALHGRQPWLQVADVIGLSPRTVRRWRWRLERHGVEGVDRRRQIPSPRRVPLADSNGSSGSNGSGIRGSTCATSISSPAGTMP
jgi:hypothetical protein